MSAFWSNRQVYLTGGTGFIGTELASEMLDRGADVTVLTRRAERAGPLSDAGCSVAEGDVRSMDSLDLGDADTVVHAAAWVAFGIPKAKRELFWDTNVTGTENVLQAAEEAGVERFCHFSSVAAIGTTPAGLYPEERAVDGRYPEFFSLYEKAKHAAHIHVLEHHGDMRTVLPMPSVVIGRGSDTEDLLRRFQAGLPFGVKGDNPTGVVHVRDVVAGTLAAIEHGEGPYILNDRDVIIRQLLTIFEEASGTPAPERELPLGLLKALATLVQVPYHLAGKVPPVSRELIRGLEVPLTYASQRARKELGWQPDLVGELEEDFTALSAGR